VSNDIYDVLGYSFELLMPVRHIQPLIKNLVDDNYHVVTNVNYRKVKTAVETASDEIDLYYYGTEPLHRVTISGQLRMMAGCTRGMAEKTVAGKKVKWVWTRKPLMPIEAMKEMIPASALRDIDKYALKQAK